MSKKQQDRGVPAGYYYTLRIKFTTVYITHPWVGFPCPISPQMEQCRCQKQSALETSRLELSDDAPFGVGTLLG